MVRTHHTDAGRRVLVRPILECIFGRGSVLKKGEEKTKIFGRGALVGNTWYMTASTFICHALRWGYISLISIIFVGFFFNVLTSPMHKTAQEHKPCYCTHIRLSPHRVPWFLLAWAQHHCIRASILPVSGRDNSLYTGIYTHMHESTALCECVHSLLYSLTLPF